MQLAIVTDLFLLCAENTRKGGVLACALKIDMEATANCPVAFQG